MDSYFPNNSYFAVSALNSQPTVVKEGNTKRYRMDVLPETVRVEEPLYWILYKLGMIEAVRRRKEKDERDDDGNGKKGFSIRWPWK